MLSELNKSIRSAGLSDPKFSAVVKLARSYAQLIDEAEDDDVLIRVGPAFLRVLHVLCLTPRSGEVGGNGEQDDANPLDELRSRRQQRTG